MACRLTIDTTSHQILGQSPKLSSQDPTEIVPFLFLGSYHAATYRGKLAAHAIKAVVNASMVDSAAESTSMRVLKLDVLDQPDTDLKQHFAACNAFIQQSLSAREAVLVHCQAGISRSATLVMAYLISSGLKPTLQEAYRHTVELKPNVHPNEGFFRQLQEYEREVRGSVTMTILDYYRDSFIGMGFPRDQVDSVLASAGTEDYHRLVSLLHSRSGSRPSSALSHMSSCPGSTEV